MKVKRTSKEFIRVSNACLKFGFPNIKIQSMLVAAYIPPILQTTISISKSLPHLYKSSSSSLALQRQLLIKFVLIREIKSNQIILVTEQMDSSFPKPKLHHNSAYSYLPSQQLELFLALAFPSQASGIHRHYHHQKHLT